MATRHDPEPQESADDERCVDTRAAAEMLGISPITLNQWRLRGQGPSFRRFSRLIRYQVRDLRDYIARSKISGGK
jgi:hypothetical protein